MLQMIMKIWIIEKGGVIQLLNLNPSQKDLVKHVGRFCLCKKWWFQLIGLQK